MTYIRFFSFYISLPLFYSLDPCPLENLDARLKRSTEMTLFTIVQNILMGHHLFVFFVSYSQFYFDENSANFEETIKFPPVTLEAI